MRFLRQIFSRSPEIDAGSAKIDEFTYLLNYRDHYSPILENNLTDRALAELYLFRAWTTQFGYRIFSSDPASSEKLIGETVNATKYLGLGIFEGSRRGHVFILVVRIRTEGLNFRCRLLMHFVFLPCLRAGRV